jgi:hypothetical protein
MVVGIFVSTAAEAQFTRITIRRDRYACATGGFSMFVQVDVDNEPFSFNPSCQFSFSQSFSTRAGVNCRIDGGMCSNFYPYKQIEVNCGSARDYVDLVCPP